MIRNLKALGLCAVAVLALGAMFASAAQAQKFTSGSAGQNISATQIGELNEFSVLAEGAEERDVVECAEGNFASNPDPEGTEATQIMFDAEYAGCEYNGLTATVNMNGCSYEFYANPSVDLSCPTGNQVTITVYLFHPSVPVCEISVSPTIDTSSTGVVAERTAEPFTGITYTDGTGEDAGNIILDVAVENQIDWSTEGFGCPDDGGSGNNGSYLSTVTVSGDEGTIDWDES